MESADGETNFDDDDDDDVSLTFPLILEGVVFKQSCDGDEGEEEELDDEDADEDDRSDGTGRNGALFWCKHGDVQWRHECCTC